MTATLLLPSLAQVVDPQIMYDASRSVNWTNTLTQFGMAAFLLVALAYLWNRMERQNDKQRAAEQGWIKWLTEKKQETMIAAERTLSESRDIARSLAESSTTMQNTMAIQQTMMCTVKDALSETKLLAHEVRGLVAQVNLTRHVQGKQEEGKRR